ncbi:hypothetical protein MX629_01340 [Carnobacterium divergens]|uniref:Uncharacterized protein n=1 Tax=Carnobacterium divergens TaxID=2748 RepID=A0AAW8R5W6_CARDV|nr:hypothetical protein [Carnobacterium divergens]MDT1957065.1 hypothetical protein [Carnobacterium divergens]MDT1973035.1 hypothetical protein [Carnobacterium divergens]
MIVNKKYWEEVSIYAIEFLTNELKERKIYKLLVFPIAFTTNEIQEAISENFYNVKEVTSIEIQLDGLLLTTNENESMDY